MNNTRDRLPRCHPSTARRADFAHKINGEQIRLTARFLFYAIFSQEEEEEEEEEVVVDIHTIGRVRRFAASRDCDVKIKSRSRRKARLQTSSARAAIVEVCLSHDVCYFFFTFFFPFASSNKVPNI